MSDPRSEFVEAVRGLEAACWKMTDRINLRRAVIAFADLNCDRDNAACRVEASRLLNRQYIDGRTGPLQKGEYEQTRNREHVKCRAALLREVGLEESGAE